MSWLKSLHAEGRVGAHAADQFSREIVYAQKMYQAFPLRFLHTASDQKLLRCIKAWLLY